MSDNANKTSEPAKKAHRPRPLRRDRPGVNAAALLLRLALGVTFLWAGAAKLMGDLEVSGENARILHEMGVIGPPGAAAASPGGAAPPAPENPSRPDPVPSEPPPPGGGGSAGRGMIPGLSSEGVAIRVVSLAARQPTAEDYATPQKVRLVHGVTLAVYKAAAGVPTATGGSKALMPAGAGKRPWPVALAYAVMATEIIGGFFALIGFLTRLSALGLAGTMAGALWLTQFGPAMASGTAWLGVIPEHPNFGFTGAGPPAYTTLLWQATLMASSLAVVMLGAGAASVDRLLRLGR